MRKLLNSPMCINWNYTYICNFNCRHCYSRTLTAGDELSTQDFLKIADQIIKAQVFWINLGGGEPLLRKDCFNIIAHMAKKGIKVNLTTNGYLVEAKTIENLAASGLDSLFISLDNMDKAKHDNFRNMEGSYERAIRCIRLSKLKGLKTYLSTVVTRENIDDIDAIVSFAEKEGLTGIDFKRFRPQGNGLKSKERYEIMKDMEPKLVEKMLKFKKDSCIEIAFLFSENGISGLDDGCPCGRVSLALLPNGDVAPCVYNQKIIGNLLKDDLQDLWQNSPYLVNLRKHFKCAAEVTE